MTAVVFPTYFLARTIVGKPAALFAATAAAAVPALAYSQVISEEALAYPYAALCFFLIAKAIVDADALVDRRAPSSHRSSPRSCAPSSA